MKTVSQKGKGSITFSVKHNEPKEDKNKKQD